MTRRASAPAFAKPTRCMDCAAREACAVGRLPPAEREALAPLIRERTFRKGEVLQEQAQMARRLGILKVGSAMVLRRGADGQRRAVGLFGRGRVMGKFALVGEPNALTCIALSAGRLCEIGVDAANDPQHARLRAALAQTVVRDFGRLADWAQVMRVRGSRGQLLDALLLLVSEQGSRRLRLPSQTALAELLGTTRETVARNLRALELTHRIVRRDRWHCEVG